MTTETISKSLLIPTKWEPKRSSRFLLDLEGIDPFLVKQIILPKWSAENGEPKILSQLTLVLYDAIAPDTAHQVIETCTKSSVEALDFKIKLLDPVGTVVHIWQVGKATVNHVDFGDLDYNNSNPIEIKIIFDIKSIELKF